MDEALNPSVVGVVHRQDAVAMPEKYFIAKGLYLPGN